MTTTFKHLQVADLTKDEQDAALECEKQLNKLRFRPQDDYEVCDDNKGLEIVSRIFIEKFAPWLKVDPLFSEKVDCSITPLSRPLQLSHESSPRLCIYLLSQPSNDFEISQFKQRLEIGAVLQADLFSLAF